MTNKEPKSLTRVIAIVEGIFENASLFITSHIILRKCPIFPILLEHVKIFYVLYNTQYGRYITVLLYCYGIIYTVYGGGYKKSLRALRKSEISDFFAE